MLDPVSKRLLENTKSTQPISVMYHGITRNTSASGWPWEISFDLFRKHLDILQEHGYQTGKINSITEKKEYSENTIFITFDDGYENNLLAFRELVERGMTASWYVVAGGIGELSNWVEPGRSEKDRLLSKEQILEMDSEGMLIGSHGWSHKKLTSLANEQLKYELVKSRESLSELLGKPVNAIAYPYGDYNQDVLGEAKRFGYEIGCTTKSGFGLVNNDPLQVRRIAVMRTDTPSVFSRKLSFASNDVGFQATSRYLLSRIMTRL